MPLTLSDTEWKRINKHLEKKDPGERNRAYISSVTKASADMTKNWSNSLENVNKRNEEMREQRAQKTAVSNEEFYKNYVAKKKKERVQMLTEAETQIFQDKDGPKTLLSGFIAADVHREWKRQTTMNKELAEQAKRRKNAYDTEQKEKYQEWKKEQHNKTLKKAQEDIELGNYVKEQARERKEKIEKLKLAEVALEQQDNTRANEELEMFKEFERQLKKKSEEVCRKAISSSIEDKIHRDEEVKIRDQLDDKLQAIYVHSKHSIDCIRKKKELEARLEKLRIAEQIGNTLRNKGQDRPKNVEEELPIFSKEKREAEAANKARLVQELKDMHEECLQKEKALKHEKATLASWEMLNRLKNEENTREFYKLEKEQKKKKILKYREELNAQRTEKKDREAKEEVALKYFYGEKAIGMLEKADKEFFAHADNVIKECLNTDRPPFAVEKVVDEYKKKFRLYPMPDVSKTTRENLERSKRTAAEVHGDLPEQNKRDVQSIPRSNNICNDPNVYIKQTLKFLPCSLCQPSQITSGLGPQLRKCHMQ